jgi:hypothetical protein
MWHARAISSVENHNVGWKACFNGNDPGLGESGALFVSQSRSIKQTEGEPLRTARVGNPHPGEKERNPKHRDEVRARYR